VLFFKKIVICLSMWYADSSDVFGKGLAGWAVIPLANDEVSSPTEGRPDSGRERTDVTDAQVYVLVAIVKKRLFLSDVSLYTILQILSITLFEKVPLLQAFTATDCRKPQGYNPKQLKLLDF